MIWFACQQCGKKHVRPESSSGTLVFCECGQGNTVPWESTVTPPEVAEAVPALPVAPPSPPPLQPIPVGEERVPPQPVRRRQRGRQRDPNFCFNHEHLPATQTCPECEEHFCLQCVVEIQGKILCGPCKNVYVRTLTRPPRLSSMALISLLVAVLTGPLLFCLLPLGDSVDVLPLGLLFLLPQLVAFVLGCLALRATETNARVGGRSLAITGMVTSAVAALLAGAMTAYNLIRWV